MYGLTALNIKYDEIIIGIVNSIEENRLIDCLVKKFAIVTIELIFRYKCLKVNCHHKENNSHQIYLAKTKNQTIILCFHPLKEILSIFWQFCFWFISTYFHKIYRLIVLSIYSKLIWFGNFPVKCVRYLKLYGD